MSLINHLQKILNKLPFFKIPYYYVPPCPVCGGMKTGRYLKEPRIDSEYLYRKSLENGEIIRFAPKEPIINCFCEECGYEWGKTISVRFITPDELIEQKRLRGTDKEYQRYSEINYINGKPPKSRLFNKWFF